ncbi:endonuclease III-like protein 1 [Anopheles darlingi]|uniref:endonuclease III-like protein 1 n=1 Tax=Anopheles darlingi TaxID=43151 RepID=UPI0020FFFF28|nr:endonuclease III-like protein 1 [Anopheles darlingi]
MLNRVLCLARTSIMESKSPYFSPKKTRNFAKQQGLSLLQKVTRATKATEEKQAEPKAAPRATKTKKDSQTDAAEIKIEPGKGRKRNIRTESAPVAAGAVQVKVEPLPEEEFPLTRPAEAGEILIKEEPITGGSPVKRQLEDKVGPQSDAAVIKVEPGKGRKRNIRTESALAAAAVRVKVEPVLEEELQLVRPAENEKTPTKREPLEDGSAVKRNLKIEVGSGLPDVPEKEGKWEPANWRQMLENIRQMRKDNPAPVDTMGCDQFAQDTENLIPAREKRYHCLVSLMLSAQTKDTVNHECMMRLKKHGLTPESIVGTDATVLEKLIYPVSFYKNKTKFIKQASQILLDQYGGDIPDSIEGLLKLPGVGKKMAHLCMGSAWNVVTGIGVDTHVHRISNWLKWVPKETKTPEDTRQALEKWLPFELWEEVNHLMVGFGQTICTSTYPRCNDCMNAPICPARGKHGIRRTPIKKEIKAEDLEF